MLISLDSNQLVRKTTDQHAYLEFLNNLMSEEIGEPIVLESEDTNDPYEYQLWFIEIPEEKATALLLRWS